MMAELNRLPGRSNVWRGTSSGTGSKALALSLMVDTFVLKLDLSDNWLQGEGAAAIAEMLKENCCVSAVDLSDNKLGIEGAKAFSAVLLENTTVVSLQLLGNEFDDHAAKHLADAIATNRKMEILDLSDNMFGDKAGKHIPRSAGCFLQRLWQQWSSCLGEAAKANNVPEELSVSKNRVLVERALHTAAGLKENKTQKRVNMSSNPVQSEGCCGVLKALQANSGTGVEILDLPVLLEKIHLLLPRHIQMLQSLEFRARWFFSCEN